jgi:molybdopterin converting factor small subunit
LRERMVVTIEFLGNQRVIAGVERVTMPITGKTLAGDALNYARSRYPGLKVDEKSAIIAVNREVVPPQTVLKANDVVCFLPHIGGG